MQGVSLEKKLLERGKKKKRNENNRQEEGVESGCLRK